MFVDSQNQLYFGDMVIGDREATPEEIAAWELSRVPGVKEKLAALDDKNPLRQEDLRKFIMLVTEALKKNGPVDLSVIPGIAQVYDVEAQAAVIRGGIA